MRSAISASMSLQLRAPPGAVDGSRIARPATCPACRAFSNARNCASRLVSCRISLLLGTPAETTATRHCGRYGPMRPALRTDERGFSMIELLVVILIVGILAAIALPTFLGQQKKGQDASAKSNARNLVSEVESCFADTQDYRQCQTASDLGGTGLPLGSSPGQVEVVASAATNFVISASSRSGNTFLITKASGGPVSRSCLGSGGGCKSGSW